MRTALAAAAAALLLSAPDARAASAEPELIPLYPSAPRAQPRRAPEPPRRPKAAVRPPEHDEVREELRRVPPERAFVTVKSRVWLARSTIDTRYSIQIPRDQIDPPADVFIGETEEREASGTMLLHSVELAPLSWFSGEFEYGHDRAGGSYTDRYWLHAPSADTLTNTNNGAVWHKPDHEDDMVLRSDHSARRQWMSANAFFRVAKGRVTGSDEMEVTHAFDLAIGGHRYTQESRFTNLERTLSTGKFFPAAPIRPIAGFDATYSSAWIGPHLGFREEIRLPAGFAFAGQFLWGPAMQYRADGFNNLDPSLRAASPNYTDAASGTAIHFRMGAAWQWSILSVEAGYMHLSFNARRGTRTYYLPDGTTENQPVEKTVSEVSGMYVGGSLRF